MDALNESMREVRAQLKDLGAQVATAMAQVAMDALVAEFNKANTVSKDFSEFVQALPQAYMDMLQQPPVHEQPLCLKLPQGVHIGGFKQLGRCIIVRKCYQDIWAMVQSYMSIQDPREQKRGFVISGTPGVGKTIMAFYVVAMLAGLKARLVFEVADKRFYMDFSGDKTKVVGGTDKDFDDVLMDGDAWWLLDDKVPDEEFCHWRPTIVFTCPRRRAIDKFCRHIQSIELRMPPWTEAELLQAVPALGRNMTAAAVRQQFKLWGGSARHVMHPSCYTKQLLDEYVRAVKNASHLEDAALGNSSPLDTCYGLIHMYPKVDGPEAYQANHHAQVGFASRYIAEAVLQRLSGLGGGKLLSFLKDVSRGSSVTAPLRERCVDIWFRGLLRQGGQLAMRSVSAHGMPQPAGRGQQGGGVNLQANNLRYFCNERGIGPVSDLYSPPTQGDIEVLDSVLYWMPDPVHDSTVYIIQCVFNETYDSRWAKVLQLAQLVHPAPSNIRYVYMVPEGALLDDFQPWQREAGQQPPAQVEEWILRIPLRRMAYGEEEPQPGSLQWLPQFVAGHHPVLQASAPAVHQPWLQHPASAAYCPVLQVSAPAVHQPWLQHPASAAYYPVLQASAPAVHQPGLQHPASAAYYPVLQASAIDALARRLKRLYGAPT